LNFRGGPCRLNILKGLPEQTSRRLKKTLKSASLAGFGHDQLRGPAQPCSVEVPVDPVRAIVIRSASGAVRFADRKSPETIRNACGAR
jgi:hypothetical protein